MKRYAGLVCFLGLTTMVGCVAPPKTLVLDGMVDDWHIQSPQVIDPVGDAAGSTDIVSLAGQRIDKFLFLRLAIAGPSNLQKPEEDGGLRISIRGSDEEVVIDTGNRQAERNGEPVPWSAVSYLGLPTHAATEFEIRVRAPSGPSTIEVTGSDTLDRPLRVDSGQNVLSEREVLVQRYKSPLRVVSWNVLHGGPFGDPVREAQGREVLKTLEPDVLLLQEVWRVADFEDRIKTLCGNEWSVHEVGGVAVASRLPLALLDLNPPVELDRRRRPKGGDNWSVMRNLFVGVDTPVGPLVVVSAHWKCCGYSGSTEDIQRMDDALTALKAIWRLRDAGVPAKPRRDSSSPFKSPVPERFTDAPIIIAGDYNLVGSRAPLEMLLTSGLADLVPIQSDEWIASTWRSLDDEKYQRTGTDRSEWKPGGFPPGRLDFVLADRRLTVSETFIADLGEPTSLSDHLPIVVDIAN